MNFSSSKLAFLSKMGLLGLTVAVGLGVNFNQNELTISPNSPAYAQTACNAIRSVAFSGRTSGSMTGKPNITTNMRANPSTSASVLATIPANTMLSFSGWTYGTSVNDLWNGRADQRWFRVTYRGKTGWVASGVIYGNPPNAPVTCINSTSTSPTSPLLAAVNAQYFLSRPQFYMQSGNGYAKANYGSSLLGHGRTQGNCTWYAYGRLKELGFNPNDVMNGFPNANQWAPLRNGSRELNNTELPQVGDVAQWYRGGQNHVAIVEKVDVQNRKVILSESHYLKGGNGVLHTVVKRSFNNRPHRYIRLKR